MTEEPMESLNERLAAVAGRLATWSQAQARLHPGARVRLDRPLEATSSPDPDAQALAAVLDQAQAHRSGPRPQPPFAPELAAFHVQISQCQACPLGAKRRHLVFGDGAADAKLVFLGDAPGREEDATGKPFQDEAGRLLDRIIAAMGYKRGQVYLLNLVKCRAAAGQEPSPEELAACRPYLEQQLSLLRPRIIVTLGALATSSLLGEGKPLAQRRGQWERWRGLRIMPTWHPGDLLKDPGLKRPVWEDMRLVAQTLNASEEPA